MSGDMKVHYSSNKHTWETPQDFFDKLNNLFNFTLDACAEDCTAKVDKYYTEEDNAPFPCALVVFSDNMYNLDSFGYCV